MNESMKSTIRRVLADEIGYLEIALVMARQREQNYWIICDPDKPDTLGYFKALNEERNRKRYLERKLRQAREAARAIKSFR